MKIKKTLLSILLAAEISLTGCKDYNSFKINNYPSEIIGPYIQNITENEAEICWLDRGENNLTFEGRKSKLEIQLNDYFINRIRLSDLIEGKIYEYKIEEKQEKFRTQPNKEEPFNFLVYGDTQNSENHKKIIEQMKRHNPSFIIHVGDQINNWRNFESLKQFLKDIGPISGRAPYYFVMGNHERNNQKYKDLFISPEKKRYYTFNHGNCRFIFLDSSELIDLYSFYEYNENTRREQLNLLNEIKPDKINFVVMHHPAVYTGGKKDSEVRILKQVFGNRLEKADVVFMGHEHNYQRFIIKNTNYIITGGGGGKLDDRENYISNRVNFIKDFHFIKVNVGETVDFTVINIDGTKIDYFKLNRKE